MMFGYRGPPSFAHLNEGTPMYEHPDYLTMAQIVNGNDDLSESATDDQMTEYIADTMGFDLLDIAGAAQDEAMTVISSAKQRGADIGVIARTAWVTGFFFSLRVSRNIKTEDLSEYGAFLDVDIDSTKMMAVGRTAFNVSSSTDEVFIAKSAWLDGAMTGIHFDKARIS